MLPGGPAPDGGGTLGQRSGGGGRLDYSYGTDRHPFSRALRRTEGGQQAMGPGVMLLVVAIALVCGFAGQAIGRPKGYPGAGLAIGLLLGVFGVVIVALMPETEAVKAARAQWQYQAQLAAAQQQYEIQAEAARRAGYPFPSPPPPGAWPPPPGWPPPNP
jgi:hypothetical protein